MRKEQIGNATLFLGTMEDTIGSIEKVDHIFTDPPYLYIKTHDFDKQFNEQLFFENAKRLLPDDGFIALFGRGTSFYRWNTRLADLGFIFKEEIVWDKRNSSSPTCPASRVHELLTIHTKKTGKIKNCNVPYTEQKENDINGIIKDIKRIKSVINNEAGLNKVINFLTNNMSAFRDRTNINNVSMPEKEFKYIDPDMAVLKSIKNGMREKTIISCYLHRMGIRNHPTEKPVRLAERILALISNEGDTIYDPFMGSGSFGVACLNTGRKYIGSEMKKEYFDIACKRIEEAAKQTDLFKAAG